MRNAIERWKAIVLCSVMFCLPEVVLAEQGTSCDSVPHPSGYAENLLRSGSYSRYPELTENVEVPEYTSRIVSSIVWG